jgi:hypothetical protein
LGAVFGGFRAEGGPVKRGKAYVVGEKGPEWFAPGENGFIGTSSSGGGFGGSPINIYNTTNAGMTPADRAWVQAAWRSYEPELLSKVLAAQSQRLRFRSDRKG